MCMGLISMSMYVAISICLSSGSLETSRRRRFKKLGEVGCFISCANFPSISSSPASPSLFLYLSLLLGLKAFSPNGYTHLDDISLAWTFFYWINGDLNRGELIIWPTHSVSWTFWGKNTHNMKCHSVSTHTCFVWWKSLQLSFGDVILNYPSSSSVTWQPIPHPWLPCMA